MAWVYAQQDEKFGDARQTALQIGHALFKLIHAAADCAAQWLSIRNALSDGASHISPLFLKEFRRFTAEFNSSWSLTTSVDSCVAALNIHQQDGKRVAESDLSLNVDFVRVLTYFKEAVSTGRAISGL